MKTEKIKKGLSLLLAVIMMLTMMPATMFGSADASSLPVIKAFTTLTGDYHAYSQKIVTVTFLDYIDEAEYAACSPYAWDISASSSTGTVKAWMKVNATETAAAAGDTRYDVYIGGNGGVAANEYSADFFYNFKKLKEVRGLENFDTSNATTFAYMFNMCESLESLDLSSWDTSNVTSFFWMFHTCKNLKNLNLSGWDTSNVTTMNCMFKNCYAVTELDLGSWDTSKVTNMNSMFFNCEKLENLYVGKGWNTENVTDGRQAFSCCDALPNFDPNNSAVDIGSADKYVKPAPEEPNPEPKNYTVTYEIIGSIIPEGVIAPEAATYEENTTVTVADKLSAEGYEFSGWSTDDAAVENGAFVINNDVHFVGSWTKLYKVEYVYLTENEDGTIKYPHPDEALASDPPAAEAHKAGDTVIVAPVATAGAEGYSFVGWSIENEGVASADGKFTMPASDVVLYGYFKKDVTGVVINTGDQAIYEDEETPLKVTVNPEDATIKDLIYESSDEEKVKVVEKEDGTVVIIPLKPTDPENPVTITVSSKDNPEKKDTIEITVISNPKVTYAFVGDVIPPNVKAPGEKKHGYGTTVDVEAVPGAEGYRFSGWSTNDATVNENGKFNIYNDVHFVGSWTKVYNVTYKYDGVVPENAPKLPEDPVIYDDGETVIVMDAPADVDGYRFTGWTTDDADVKGGKFVIHNDVELVGSWEKINYYNVTYKYEGDIPENAPEFPTVTYEENEIVIVEEIPYVEGYTFTGWTTDDADVKGNKFEIHNDVEFVGKWTKLYNVTYEYVGEIIPENAPAVPEAKTYKKGDTVTVAGVPSVDGYIFTGWTLTTDGVTITDGSFEIYKDVHFVGKWTKLYNVTYEYVGEIIPENAPAVPEAKTYKEGDTVTVAGVPSVDRYIFSGWTTDDATVENGEFVINNDVHFVGKWTKINYYNVTYKYEGDIPENAPEFPTVTYKEGTTVTIEKAPYVEGYEFIGWSTDDATVENGEFVINNDVEFIGKWTKINYYTVTYWFVGEDIPEEAELPAENEYEEGTEVTVADVPSVEGYTFAGWTLTTEDVAITDGNFVIDKNVNFIGTWTKNEVEEPTPEEPTPEEPTPEEPTPEEPEYVIEAPEKLEIKEGLTELIYVKVTPNDGSLRPTFSSADESIAKVDDFGNVTGVKAGTTTIYVSFPNGEIRPVAVTVLAPVTPGVPSIPKTHYVCFGKTDGIGWYEVSVNGGDFFPQGPNSTLEVQEGSVLVIRTQDMWIGDEFDFYINGERVESVANTITVVVDGYMLIGALSMDVEVPDVDESLNLFQRIIRAIKNFFGSIGDWFAKIFS